MVDLKKKKKWPRNSLFCQQQNMEIHLKIKRSKKELEALENQEREVNKTFKVGLKLLLKHKV